GHGRSLKASRGFDAGIASTVPMSAGLSSSAALLLATARALEAAGATPPSEPLEAARAARQAENAFVGVPCGLMDQFIVACGVAGGACLLDCLDETWRVVQAELPDALWVVVASGIRRELTGGDYGSRVRASRAALERVREITSIPMEELRLLDPDLMAEACASARVDPEGARLLRHFVTENQRVLGMQEALEARDSGGAGALLSRGHWSLSRDFGVSLPVLDRFVRRCEGLSGCLGVRITGAGFGGSLVALVQEGDAGEGVAEAAREELPDGHQVLPIPGFCGGADGWKL
ncbi:MAG: hypothetical protein FJ098_05685, partial [Deltaproteobacteria bacterium]|nr:hypothetical protein [Deltaproteobacteria bacterium]